VYKYARHCGTKTLKPTYLAEVVNSTARDARLFITAFGDDGGIEGFAVVTFIEEKPVPTYTSRVFRKAYLELVCSGKKQGTPLVKAGVAVAHGLGMDFVQLSAATTMLKGYYQKHHFNDGYPNPCAKLSRSVLIDPKLAHQYTRQGAGWIGNLDATRKHTNGSRNGYLMSRCLNENDPSWTLGALKKHGTALRFVTPVRAFIPKATSCFPGPACVAGSTPLAPRRGQ